MRDAAPLPHTRQLISLALATGVALLGGLAVGAVARRPPGDVLGAEIERAAAVARSQHGTAAAERNERMAATIERALEAWQGGRRTLALHRFAPVFAELHARAYLRDSAAPAEDPAAVLQTAWERQGRRLAEQAAGTVRRGALDALRPAAVRAIAEAALLQTRGYHSSSLLYGKATDSRQGLYYLGSAAGQQALLELCLRLDEPASGTPPRLRSIAGEVAALERDLGALYQPPASVGRHADFIAASATLKEARELDEAGLHHGALLRYLQAAMQLAVLRAGAAPPAAEVHQRLAEHARRLAGGGVDHTIGRIYLEAGQAHLVAEPVGSGTSAAAAIAGDVLPRYLAALAPPPAAVAPRAAALSARSVTVTLVRWPYT